MKMLRTVCAVLLLTGAMAFASSAGAVIVDGSGGGGGTTSCTSNCTTQPPTNVPEPGVFGMFALGLGLTGLFVAARKRRH